MVKMLLRLVTMMLIHHRALNQSHISLVSLVASEAAEDEEEAERVVLEAGSARTTGALWSGTNKIET